MANVQCRRLLHLKWASAHFFFFFPLSFFFSLFLSLSPLPLFLPSAMVSKRCKSIWNLVIKHTHKKCRWVSSELRLSYVFFLKVQKKSYKNKKSYQRKRKKKKSWAEMRQKSYIPQHFSPFVFAFHFIVRKDMEWQFTLQTPTAGRHAPSHSTVPCNRCSHTHPSPLPRNPVCWTHTLGHHKNGPLLSRSHSKHTDVFPWGAHPPLTVDIHLVLKILRLIYLCCMFPAWFLTRTVKTGSNEVWHPKDLPPTSVTLRLLSYEDV